MSQDLVVGVASSDFDDAHRLRRRSLRPDGFGRRRGVRALGSVVALVLGACPSRVTTSRPELLPVPLVRQSTTYTCGVAALMSILYYYDRYDGREGALADRLGATERDGTRPERILAVAREFGLRAELRQGVTVEDLRAALGRREPVIVDLQAWADDTPRPNWRDRWEDGHYVVAVGIDRENLYVMDPSTAAGYAFLPLRELLDRWHDYESAADGGRIVYRQMAIFLAGGRAVGAYPRPPTRMN